MHELLTRQLKDAFGGLDAVPTALHSLIAAVDRSYALADAERAGLERSVNKISGELDERLERLRTALSERENVQEALSLLSATLESTTDGILVVDLSGRIVRTNRKFAELWRIPDAVLRNRDDAQALDFVLGQLEAPEAFLQKVHDLYNSHDEESFDVLHFKDGRTFERYSRPQRVAGKTLGRVWSFRDVTERVQLEEQLRQSHKMEAIGLLAGGIAHDFNNLLTVIRANGELLLQALTPDAAQRLDVEEIIKAANRAAELARQLLAFGRKQILQAVHFDFNVVVTELEPMVRRIIGEDIQVSTRPSGEPGIVLADRGQLEQVLLNLVINARDAMPRGGLLTIEMLNVELTDAAPRPGKSAIPPGAYVVLSVADTGVGIPRDQIGRVFEPFFTTKDVGKGTGLGLSTLYGIVKQSGGYIWVDSEVGMGTTFRIYLPRVLGVVVPSADPMLDRLDARGSETVLVTEDEEAVRSLIIRALESEGYTVLPARHGRDALALAREHAGKIDLLVTDVIMPEMGGRELVEQLSAVRPGMRVLYISGYTNREIDRSGMLDAEAAFLPKPFTGSALTRAVRAALDDTRHSREAGDAT